MPWPALPPGARGQGAEPGLRPFAKKARGRIMGLALCSGWNISCSPGVPRRVGKVPRRQENTLE